MAVASRESSRESNLAANHAASHAASYNRQRIAIASFRRPTPGESTDVHVRGRVSPAHDDFRIARLRRRGGIAHHLSTRGRSYRRAFT